MTTAIFCALIVQFAFASSHETAHTPEPTPTPTSAHGPAPTAAHGPAPAPAHETAHTTAHEDHKSHSSTGTNKTNSTHTAAAAEPTLDDMFLFAGGIAFFAFLFYMSNKGSLEHAEEDKDHLGNQQKHPVEHVLFCGNSKRVRGFTWGWIRTCASIFIGVIAWAPFGLYIFQTKERMQKDPLHTEAAIRWTGLGLSLVAFSLEFVIYILSVVVFTVKCLGCFETFLGFFAVWSHVLGFSSIHVIAYVQDVSVELLVPGGLKPCHTMYRSNSSHHTVDDVIQCKEEYIVEHPEYRWMLTGVTFLTWCACAAVLGALFFTCHYALMRWWVVPRARDSPHLDHSKHHRTEKMNKLVEHLRELPGEALALGTAFTLMRVDIGLITSELPEIMQTTSNEKSVKDKVCIIGCAIFMTILAMAYNACKEPCFHRHKGMLCRCLTVVREYVQQFLTFGAAFTWLYAIRWLAYDANLIGVQNPKHSLFMHILIAFGISFLGLFSLVFTRGLEMAGGCFCDFVVEWIIILAILAALSWEVSLDLMVEQLASGHLKPPWNGVTNTAAYFFLLIIFLVLLPVFLFCIYPESMNIELGKVIEAGENEDEDEGSEASSDLVSEDYDHDIDVFEE